MLILLWILVAFVIFVIVIYEFSSKTKEPPQPLPPIIRNSKAEEMFGHKEQQLNVKIKIDTEFSDPQKLENSMKYYEEYTRNSSNPKFYRTDAEKRLRSDFSIQHSSDIKRYENQAEAHLAFDKTLDICSRINICKNALNVLYEFKDYCYKYPGGAIYFQDMWEYCHNSHSECFSRIAQLEELLAELIENKEDFLYRESRLPTLRQDIIEYIATHDNVIQKNMYPDFGIILKSDIQKELRNLEQEGIINRTKKSGSYLLTLT